MRMKKIKDTKLSKNVKHRRKMKSPTAINNSDSKDKNAFSEMTVRSLSYGVLGIGNLGSKIVNSLTKTAKKIHIWNRDQKKCHKLLKNLDSAARSYVEICHIPSLVIQRSDIIFNCISDCHGSKAVVHNSLAMELAPSRFMLNKGLIDMSGLDPEGHRELNDLVETKGGKYLEVKIQIRNESAGGGYLILGGGNAELFTAFQNFSGALGWKPYYLGKELGYATKLNLIMQAIKSVCLVGITEGFSLLERIVPSDCQKEIMPILFSTPIASDYVKSKAVMVFCKKFDLMEQPLKDLQKDIRFAMEMANNVSEPMYLLAVVDQILKHCQKLGYGDVDPAAVFMRIRH